MKYVLCIAVSLSLMACEQEGEADYLPLQAFGAEPGWTLQWTNAAQLEFIYAYGQEQYVLQIADVEQTDNGWHITAAAPDVEVSVQKLRCNSVGEGNYPYGVLLTYKNKQHYGCGELAE